MISISARDIILHCPNESNSVYVCVLKRASIDIPSAANEIPLLNTLFE